MPETRQQETNESERIRANPGKFGQNEQTGQTGQNRAWPGKTGQNRVITGIFRQKQAFLGNNGHNGGKKTVENRAKPDKKRAKNGQTKQNPGETGRSQKFRRF